MLAPTPGEVLTAEQLIDCPWSGRQLSGARNAVQNCMPRLGLVLRAESGAEVLLNSPGGYRSEVVGAHRFRALVSSARSAEPEQSASLLDGTLDLWRGEPLADGSSASCAARWRQGWSSIGWLLLNGASASIWPASTTRPPSGSARTQPTGRTERRRWTAWVTSPTTAARTSRP